MSVVEITHLTKDYGGKGVFNLSFSINAGEVVGFIGPNGAGKTTTIRHLMGFLKPDSGSVRIFGKDCFKDAASIQQKVGYLPGENTLIGSMTGKEFIQFMASMKNITSMKKAEELMDIFNLDSSVKIRKMSKGMKQKVGLVTALMQEAEVLILDEPSSGLDPLMQKAFIQCIEREKSEGRTILMSSHIFEEIEHTCDRVVMIKDGRLAACETMANLRENQMKYYSITFETEKEAVKFEQCYPGAKRLGKTVTFFLRGQVNQLLKELSSYSVLSIDARRQTLEEIFMQYYGGSNEVGVV